MVEEKFEPLGGNW